MKKQMDYIIGGIIGGVISVLFCFILFVWKYDLYEDRFVFIDYSDGFFCNKSLTSDNTNDNLFLLYEKLKTEKVILSPHEYTSHLGSYYNSLIAVLVGLFIVFSFVSFVGIRGITKREILEHGLILENYKSEIETNLKKETKVALDEMIKDSIFLQEKLNQAIYGIVEDTIGEIIEKEKIIEFSDKLNELKKEVATLNEIVQECGDSDKVIKIKENE